MSRAIEINTSPYPSAQRRHHRGDADDKCDRCIEQHQHDENRQQHRKSLAHGATSLLVRVLALTSSAPAISAITLPSANKAIK
jgi:hypothetical protein